jgi:hypothetical protein
VYFAIIIVIRSSINILNLSALDFSKGFVGPGAHISLDLLLLILLTRRTTLWQVIARLEIGFNMLPIVEIETSLLVMLVTLQQGGGGILAEFVVVMIPLLWQVIAGLEIGFNVLPIVKVKTSSLVMLVTLQQGGGGGALVEFVVSVIVHSLLLLLLLPLFLLLVIVLLEIRVSQHRIGSKGLEAVVEIDPGPLIGIVHPDLLIGIISPHIILIPSSLSTLVLLPPLLLSEPHSIPSELTCLAFNRSC